MSLKDQLPDRLPLLADLLMDAAYADDHLEGEEKMAVKRLLREILDVQTLPMDLDFRIDEFDPKKFDRAKTLAAFAARSERAEEAAHRAGAPRSTPRTARSTSPRTRSCARSARGWACRRRSFRSWWSTSSRRSIDLGEDLDRLRYGG